MFSAIGITAILGSVLYKYAIPKLGFAAFFYGSSIASFISLVLTFFLRLKPIERKKSKL